MRSFLQWRVLPTLLALLGACISSTTAAASSVAPHHRVALEVFYRAFCPACQWFVSDPLLELMRNEQFRTVVDLQLFPAAGMWEENGELHCEGGALECTGHRVQACLIDKDRSDVTKYLGNIACIERDESGNPGDWSEKMKNCFTEEELVVVDTCYKTKSDALLRDMIVTHKAGTVEWMPWTVIDGKVMGSETDGVGLAELHASICAAYKGPKQFYPDVCSTVVGEQKQVAADAVETVTEPPVVATPAAAVAAQENAENDEIELDVKEEEVATKVDAVAPTPISGGKVRLDLYWRAFCPGCMAFITKPLLQLLRDEEFRNSIDFRPVPAAGTSLDNSGKFVCSMGLVECMGHKWMSCAIDLYPKVDELIEYLACLESKDNKGVTWSFVITKCFQGDNAKRMRECYDTRSDDLLRQHIVEREKVDVLWVPYVQINGVPIGDARTGIAYKQLSDEVCKGFTGPVEKRPSGCRPKRLRVDEPKTEAATEPVIKPCPPKKKSKEGASKPPPPVADADEDVPGIGARIDQEHPQADIGALAAANKNGRVLDPEAEPDSDTGSAIQTLAAPAFVLVIVGVVAYRFFSTDHKKDA